MIASLEQKEFIKKVDDPFDKRTFKVHLTTKGKQLEKNVAPVLQKAQEDVLNGISEEQFILLKDLMKK